ncbi:DUF202 domain-containing protein [Vibrio rumoiensis]|uniref:DUF202 domain-containing protein n=1 Tax=Vibrio rumoiensis TaxID=76258 RepID=A0ABW7J2Z6_9VIBR
MLAKRESDGGLQAERTSLSWYRTIFVLLLDCLLVIRVGYTNHNEIVFYAGVLLVILTMSFYLSAVYRSPKLSLNIDLTNKSSIWMKRYLSALLCIASLMVTLSCMINIYYIN